MTLSSRGIYGIFLRNCILRGRLRQGNGFCREGEGDLIEPSFIGLQDREESTEMIDERDPFLIVVDVSEGRTVVLRKDPHIFLGRIADEFP